MQVKETVDSMPTLGGLGKAKSSCTSNRYTILKSSNWRIDDSDSG